MNELQIKKTNNGPYLCIGKNGGQAYNLTIEQCESLYLDLCGILFDDMLDKNKDILYRLKHNIPAPDHIIGTPEHIKTALKVIDGKE